MTQHDNDGSFEQRLRSARMRQGLDPVDRAGKNSMSGAWGIGTRVGVELLAALVVGTAIGYALDWFLKTGPAFLILGIPLGGAAGLLNVWRVMGPRKQ